MKTSSYSPSTSPAVPPDQACRRAEGQTLSIDTNGPFYAKLFVFQKGPCLTGGVIHKNHFIKQTPFMRGLIPFRGAETGSLAWISKGEELIATRWIQTQVAGPAQTMAKANFATPSVPGMPTFMQASTAHSIREAIPIRSPESPVSHPHVFISLAVLHGAANEAVHDRRGQWGLPCDSWTDP